MKLCGKCQKPGHTITHLGDLPFSHELAKLSVTRAAIVQTGGVGDGLSSVGVEKIIFENRGEARFGSQLTNEVSCRLGNVGC